MRVSSAKGWAIIGMLAAAVVLALAWTLVISPVRSNTADVQEQVAAQLEANTQSAQVLAKLKAQSATLPAQKAALKAAESAIPTSEQAPDLIRSLNDAAAASGVSLDQLTRATPIAVGASPTDPVANGLQEIPLTIKVTGTYPQTQNFLANIEKMPRAVLVHGVTLGDAQGTVDSKDAYTTQLTAGAFFNPEPGKQAQPTAAATPSDGSGAVPAQTGAPS